MGLVCGVVGGDVVSGQGVGVGVGVSCLVGPCSGVSGHDWVECLMGRVSAGIDVSRGVGQWTGGLDWLSGSLGWMRRSAAQRVSGRLFAFEFASPSSGLSVSLALWVISLLLGFACGFSGSSELGVGVPA